MSCGRINAAGHGRETVPQLQVINAARWAVFPVSEVIKAKAAGPRPVHAGEPLPAALVRPPQRRQL